MTTITETAPTFPYELNDQYLNLLVKPYSDTLQGVDNNGGEAVITSLKEWIKPFYPEEKVDTLFQRIDELNRAPLPVTENIQIEQTLPFPEEKNYPVIIQKVKETIIEFLKLYILDTVLVGVEKQLNQLTVWDLASFRTDKLTSLIGSPSAVPVEVLTGPQKFQHNISEEFTLGILLGLIGNENIKLTLFGFLLDPNYIYFLYNNPTSHKYNYAAETVVGPVYFKSPDFIQGVLTASSWINTDAHSFVTKLEQVTETGDKVQITF